ncbi:helix-turn-helix domain-containing protein [Dactylosporangium sp. CS-033363]|uniref:helix-turn-helix domain-containing protein n=1 Tax=Dactylosporangium sp. CS-033363 TaxID=3239935 RepID=UPI003D8F7557
MRSNLAEPVTIDDLARAAMFSKFHFSRMFQRVTGVSPGRFLSAIRLEEAKHLLLTTSLNVADISMRVGYNSVGTFSSRFSRSVGVSPTAYRRLGGYIATIPSQDPCGPDTARISGRIGLPAQLRRPGLIFIGLFPTPIPEGRPVSCAVLRGPGSYELRAMPGEQYYLLAHGVTGDPEAAQQPNLTVATCGPLAVERDARLNLDVMLQPVGRLDLPVLLALQDARKTALQRMADDPARHTQLAAA